MGKRRTWTEEQFKVAVQNNFSVSGTLRELNLSATGANYKTIYRYVKEFGLDTSHWTGCGHLRGKTHNWNAKISMDKILVKESTYSNNGSLKKRLFEDNLLENKCSICGLTEWLNNRISLQLDHINGVNNDNRIENLRILCPNCHSQTVTFCRGAMGFLEKKPKRKREVTKTKVEKSNKEKHKSEYNLCHCGSIKRVSSKSCIKCFVPTYKIDWPEINELKKMVESSNYLAVSKILGVSDNAIRKHIKNNS